MLQIFCACCGAVFGICKSCYRGHKYCDDRCRKAGYRHVHAKAQRTYRLKKKGRKQHRDAEARRRQRKKTKCGEESKLLYIVRQSCTCIGLKLTELFLDFHPAMGIGRCVICGNMFVIDENHIEIVDPITN